MPPADPRRSGLVYGFASYILWGVLPLYFLLLAPANAWEIVAWRILWSLAFCALLLTVTRGWSALASILREPRALGMMAIAAVLIYVNWQVFVLAATTGHVVEGAMGYFINPIVTIALGVIVLREHLRRMQWIAVGVSIVAVVVLTVAYGSFPWIALALAGSFGAYGLVKNRVGARIDAVSGLTIETMYLVPVAVVQLVVVGATGGITFGEAGAWNAIALAGSGVVTAVPLLLFAAATRRIPLVWVGLLQYIAPILQFFVGVFLEHEEMSAARWAGFALIWVALVLITFDAVRTWRIAVGKVTT